MTHLKFLCSFNVSYFVSVIKRKLTGDLTIKQKDSMDDAKMLSGYFMALVENQYGKK